MNISTDLYPQLSGIVSGQGLLNKQPRYYAAKILSTAGMLALSITLLFLLDNFWLQLLNAAFLALVFGQIGFLGHDAGHRSAFKSMKGNEAMGLAANLFMGVSRSWWITQHNQHHTAPNDLESDPHTLIPVLAFSRETALKKNKFLRWLVQYQAFYFVPLLFLEGVGMRVSSTQFLRQGRRVKYPVIEPLLMALHFLAYFGLLFYVLTPWEVLGFVVVHQGLFGLYYGTVFAPNHKGMLILEKDNPLDFLRTQVLTTRNIKPGLFTDFWYGGLNYQIEHHLFPLMPRNKLGEARHVIKAFCQQHHISYYETGTLRSYWEILSYLNSMGADGRGGQVRGQSPEPTSQLETGRN